MRNLPIIYNFYDLIEFLDKKVGTKMKLSRLENLTYNISAFHFHFGNEYKCYFFYKKYRQNVLHITTYNCSEAKKNYNVHCYYIKKGLLQKSIHKFFQCPHEKNPKS
jgi:hypothetical protein